ncbi:MAG: hypothetical protein U1F98_10950 [Verrucomicrobiota bacterium]
MALANPACPSVPISSKLSMQSSIEQTPEIKPAFLALGIDDVKVDELALPSVVTP